jgi:hypothetical protein
VTISESGGAVWFEATSNAADLRAAAGASFAGWVRVNEAGTFSAERILYIGENAINELFIFMTDRDTVTIQMSGANGFSETWDAPADIFVNNEWIHLAVCLDAQNDTTAVYCDGTLLTLNTSNKTVVDPFVCLPANTRARFWNSLGSGSDISYAKWRVYNRGLSAGEVMADYTEGIKTGIISEWMFDDGSGVTANETSGTYASLTYNETPDPSWTTNFDWGLPPIVNDDGFLVYSDFGLAWSDANYPHVFRTENYTPVSDRITGLAAFNQTLILFCENSVQAVPLSGLGQSPYLLTDDVRCIAPHSVVSTPSGVFFYDGAGISMTDGQQIIPVTAYRANDYLGYINNSRAVNIRGVYDPQKRRVEYYFSYGDDVNNNFGLTISTDSLNCYPSQRLDVNAAWIDRSDDGELIVRHGTTDDVGEAAVWTHDPDLGTDTGQSQELVGNILSITNRTLTVDFGEDLDPATVVTPGDPCMLMPDNDGSYFQFKLVSITAVNPPVTGQYEIVVEDDADISAFAVSDRVIIGGIPFDYGIKWTDFASPQHRHKIRQLHIDVTDFNGLLFVEHYADMKDYQPTTVTTHYVNLDATKVVSNK